MDFIVAGNLSFNVSQLPSLHSLLETVSGRKVIMPTRRKFMHHLNTKFNDMKERLKATLKEQKFLCVTCDVWSSRGQSYLGVTVHFINEEFQRESYLLAFKRLYTRQTYLQLAHELDGIFKDFGIDIEQITNIVTDGGSAFCKMFKEFGNITDAVIQDTPEDEYEDDSNTISSEPEAQHAGTSTNSSDEDQLDTVQPFMQTELGELFQSDVLNFDSVEDTESDDYFGDDVLNQQPQLKLPPQRRCFSHLLNLSSQDFEKELPSIPERAFKQTYNKLNALWHTTNRSSFAKTICQNELGCLLKIPCETRWNSKFDSIKKAFEICKGDFHNERNKLNILIRRLKTELKSANHLQTLEQSDYYVMDNYIKVMQPVACALDTLQGEYNCSQGMILPVISSMKFRISSLEENCNIITDFKRTMLLVSIGHYY